MWRQYDVVLRIYQNLSTDFDILFLLISLRMVYSIIVPEIPLSIYYLSAGRVRGPSRGTLLKPYTKSSP